MITGAARSDTSVNEFAHLVLQLRDDLKFSVGNYEGADCYIIEDPVRSRFYRIGMPEYRFIACFDGRRSVADAVSATAGELAHNALGEQDAVVIVDWLLESELATTRGTARTARLMQGEERRQDANFLKRVNLMFLKVPMFNPNRILGALLPATSWLFGGLALLPWLALVLSGMWLVLSNWSQFVASSAGIFAAGGWLMLLVVWAGLKVLHEFAHGLVCRRYGGDVLEAGVIFVLFAPIGYVDATSSWRFESKWRRMHTAVAGMYIEFAVAGCAAWVWATTSDPYHAQIAHYVVLVASVNTLLFNANPLMKFDGYYVFADWLEIPNLYTRGQQSVKTVLMRAALGLDVASPLEKRRERVICTVYGFASLVWRVAVVATLLIVAQSLFNGVGALIAIISAVVLLGVPLFKFGRFLMLGDHQHRPRFGRFAITVGIVGALGVFVFQGIELAPRVTAPAIVDFSDLQSVRAETEGFVEEVRITAGGFVSAGEVLVVLENLELRNRIADMKLQLDALQLRRRTQLVMGEVAAAQADQREIATLTRSLEQHQTLVKGLTVVAQRSGQVLTENIESLQGQFVNRGDDLVTIATQESREVRVSIAQKDVASFRAKVGKTVSVRIEGESNVTPGRLERVEPKASSRVEHEAISALAGGDILVRQAEDGSGIESIEPRFSALVSIERQGDATTLPGQTAVISLLAGRESVGILVYRRVREWVRQTVELASNVAKAG